MPRQINFTKNIIKTTGNITVISVFFVLGLLSLIFSLSYIITSGLRRSVASTNSLVAYYAAEADLEKGMYEARKTATAVSALNHDWLTGLAVSPYYVDKVSVKRVAVSGAEQLEFPSLFIDQTLEIPLYDVDNESLPFGVTQVSITSSGNLDPNVWLKAGYVEWTPGSIDTAQLQKTIWQEVSGNGATVGIDLFDLNSNSNYILRLKAIGGNIEDANITIEAFNSLGGLLPIPYVLNLQSFGRFGGTERQVRASFPRYAPLWPLFDYVIFTSGDIVKP